MIRSTPRRWLAMLLSGLLLPIGACNKAADPVDQEEERKKLEMQDIGHLFKRHQDLHNQPPTKLADFEVHEPGHPFGYFALQTGDCVAIWGVDITRAPPTAVVAYRKEALSEGGLVLLADLSVATMTAAELKAALGK